MRWLTSSVVLAVFLWAGAVASALAQTAPPVETPAFQAGPARAGWVAGTGVQAPLERAWSVDLGAEQQAIVAAGGRVFLRDDEGLDRPLVAIELRSGRELWRRSIDWNTIFFHVAYADGRVYVGGHDTRAHDAATGAELWRSPEGSDWPVVEDGRVLLGDNSRTAALRAADGDLLWSSPTPDSLGGVTAGAGLVFRGGCCPGADAFDAVTGAQVWKSGRGRGYHVTPGAFDGEWTWVQQSGGGEPLAYEMRTGRVVAQLPAGYTPALAGTNGYYVRRDGRLVSFDARTTTVRWTLDLRGHGLDYYGNPRSSWPLVVDGMVFVATNDRLVAADRETGAVEWSDRLSSELGSGSMGLAAADGHVVVPTSTGADAFRTQGWVSQPPLPGQPPADDQPSPPSSDGHEPPAAMQPPPTATPSRPPTDAQPTPPARTEIGMQPEACGCPAQKTHAASHAVRRTATLQVRARLRGRTLLIRVRTPTDATGRVRLTVHSRTKRIPLRQGHARLRLNLRAADPRPRRVRVRYSGDASYAPRARTVRVG